MRHNLKIGVILLSMFIITQFIGIYVINYYSPTTVVNNIQQNITTPNQLPFDLQPPPIPVNANFWATYFPSILISFVIAISLFFILTKFKAKIVLRGWFFFVIVIALSVSFISFFPSSSLIFILIALAIAIPLAFFKTYRQNFLIHNLTELFIYPGIAAVFVALLSSPSSPNTGVLAIAALLILISVYDMWAVWHSKIMQKMAKYQINKLRIFAGFLIPFSSKNPKLVMNMKKPKKGKKNKVKINIALLGGGDVEFPLIAAGVVLRRFGFTNVLGLQLPLASLMIVLGATLGLSFLFFLGERKKLYPAMPFISIGVFVALGLCYLIL